MGSVGVIGEDQDQQQQHRGDNAEAEPQSGTVGSGAGHSAASYGVGDASEGTPRDNSSEED